MEPLTNAQKRSLKGQAQRMKASLEIGKDGLSPQFLAALNEALNHHELIKVKFGQFKEEKKELSPKLADLTGSHLITRVGNVAVLFRPKTEKAGKAEPTSAPPKTEAPDNPPKSLKNR
jgi:RNA-binding protein